jgi:pyruvate/2-oxoglutarate dehydrogenase complex dihydrolipoamide acyltransferase (E2) component
VKKGEVLLRIETDKSEMDVEADEEGYLLGVTAAEGQLVPCGETIGWLGAKGEKL